jgi:AcrR family transcriptional regulator
MQQNNFRGLDKSLRKQKIIDTAIEVFHEKGYRAATLEDVAKMLGLTKAALYHYVSSKEELLSIIYIQAIDSFFAHAFEIAGRDLTPPEKLRLLIHDHVERIITDNLAMFAVFFSEENQLPDADFRKIRKEQRKYNQVFKQIIEEGIDQGFFRPVDPSLHVNAILGMLNWLYRWYKPGTGRQTPDEIANHFVDLIENGYLKLQTESKQAPKAVTEPRTKKEILAELKSQSDILSKLIQKMETLD